MSPKNEFIFAIVVTLIATSVFVASAYHSAWTGVLVAGCVMVAGIVVAFRAAMVLLLGKL